MEEKDTRESARFQTSHYEMTNKYCTSKDWYVVPCVAVGCVFRVPVHYSLHFVYRYTMHLWFLCFFLYFFTRKKKTAARQLAAPPPVVFFVSHSALVKEKNCRECLRSWSLRRDTPHRHSQARPAPPDSPLDISSGLFPAAASDSSSAPWVSHESRRRTKRPRRKKSSLPPPLSALEDFLIFSFFV